MTAKIKKKSTASLDQIELSKTDAAFGSDIISVSDVNIDYCWQCKACAGGCPFSEFMDYHPNQLIRLVQLGMKKTALESSTIWICVGCNTCSAQCPQGIDMSNFMDALRQAAIKEGAAIAEPDVLKFHKEVVNSIYRYGRIHKLELMMRYNLSRRNPFGDFKVGLRMLKKRKLPFLPSKVRRLPDIRKLFKHAKAAHNAS
jgi:heterodisulfide reductase subunit C